MQSLKRRKSLLLSVLLILSFLFSCMPSAPLTHAAEARGPIGTPSSLLPHAAEAGEPTGTISIKWMPNNGDTLDLKPNLNVEQTVGMKVDFSLGGTDTAAPANSIEIRIPMVFYNRDGSPIQSIEMTLPSKSEADAGNGGESNYCYYIDTDTKEIVIVNYRDVSGTGVTLSVEMSWKYYPYKVKSGYNKDDIQAKFTFDADDDGASELSGSSNALKVSVETDANLNTFTKSFSTKYEKWLPEWGTAPADADDYFYIAWSISYRWSATSTQPNTITITDTPGQNGIIVAYKRAIESRFKLLAEGSTYQSVEKFDNPPSISYSDSYSGYTVLVKYPKSELTATYTNEAKATLVGEDGAFAEKKANASYVYQSVNFNYSGDSFSLSKGMFSSGTKSQTSNGSINKLENGDPAVCNSLGTKSLLFYLQASARGWGLTDNGTKDYTTELIDDQIYMDNKLLSPEDYSINYFSIQYEEYLVKSDENNGLSRVSSTDYSAHTPVIVYYKTATSTDWEKAGSVIKTGYINYLYTDAATNETMECGSNSIWVPLPKGVCAVKFAHTSKNYEIGLYVALGMTFYPTDTIKTYVENKDSIKVTNIDTLKVTDASGQIVNGTDMKSINGTLKSLITNYDQSAYGQTLMHDYADLTLSRIATSRTIISKTAGNATTNPSGQYTQIPYTVVVYEQGYYSADAISMEEALALEGFVRLQQHGTFYDLLPMGSRVDPASVSAVTYMGAPRVCTCTVEFFDNWQGSGRTMMIINITAPTNPNNYYTNGNVLDSGFTLNYSLIYPWQSITLYGSTLTNNIAYRNTDKGGLGSGQSVSESSLTSNAKPYFTDLNNDGESDDGNKDTVYANSSKAFSFIASMETGFSKKVKASDEPLYNGSAEVSATGTYSYRLYFGNGSVGTAKGLIFYDILEAYESGDSQWKGTLKSVDVSYAEKKGIKPVVYYSIVSMKDGFTEAENDLINYKDLSDTEIWSTTQPEDLSKVTAIAVDLSKTTNGSDYLLSKNEAMLCLITMQAPPNYADYLNPTVYAWNRAYYTITSILDTGSQTTLTEECNNVKVSLREPDIGILKSSDPASGTKETPALVQGGESLNYTLTVTNSNTYEDMKEVEITDTLSNGFIVDFDNIMCYFGTDKTKAIKVSNSSRISVAKTEQTLVFTVDKLMHGEKLNLVIPGTVAQNDPELLENTAIITSLNGYDMEIYSNITYHQPKKVIISLTGIKKLTGKTLIDNMFGFVVKDNSGKIVASGKNKADGTIKFSDIAITTPGEYVFIISEANDGALGIIYDNSEHPVTWRVTDNNGTLKAEMIAPTSSGTVVFNNTYTANSTSISLTGTKKLTGKTLIDNMFSFVVKDNSGNIVASGKNRADGTITFTEIGFERAGTYTYTVSEIDDKESGINYDGTVYTITVIVVENGDSTITATVSYPIGGIVFNNAYTPTPPESTPAPTSTEATTAATTTQATTVDTSAATTTQATTVDTTAATTTQATTVDTTAATTTQATTVDTPAATTQATTAATTAATTQATTVDTTIITTEATTEATTETVTRPAAPPDVIVTPPSFTPSPDLPVINGRIIQPSDYSDIFYIFDEDGTPLGFIHVPEGKTIDEINVLDDMIPFGNPEVPKSNPKTGDGVPLIIMTFASFSLITLLVLVKRRLKSVD